MEESIPINYPSLSAMGTRGDSGRGGMQATHLLTLILVQLF